MYKHDISIVDVTVLEAHKLLLRFSDGKEGIVDVAKAIHFIGLFEPLKECHFFAGVRLTEMGTLSWQNGADLLPGFLYEKCQPLTNSDQ